MRLADVQPERALRWLDSLDGLAFAVRLVCAGYWGRRLRLLGLTATLVLLVIGRFPPS
ncbi:MAG: hypothetical protein IT486_03300 [Gammaproteobacteria bacterium]|nr:hypothetical protein [Gammaproteobacteria bacterium]